MHAGLPPYLWQVQIDAFRAKVQVAPCHRDKFLLTAHTIPQSVLGLRARGESAEVLYVIGAQCRDDPAGLDG